MFRRSQLAPQICGTKSLLFAKLHLLNEKVKKYPAAQLAHGTCDEASD